MKIFKSKKFFIALCITISLSFLIGYKLNKNVQPECISEIHFIDVGQGDSVLIHNKNYNILIDSGPGSEKSKVLKYLNKEHVKKLDYIIATHPHEDHIGAMDKIINRFDIGTFIAPKITTPDIEFNNMINALNSKRTAITSIPTNYRLQLDSDSYIDFLWTGENYKDDNLNNYSIVCKYTFGERSVLFTGDCEKDIENKLVASNSSLKADILKVPHHGSSTSSTEQFINKVKPSISIISCGMGNEYGHPNKPTLQSLANINSLIFRTDINGDIILKTDGNSFSILTEKKN